MNQRELNKAFLENVLRYDRPKIILKTESEKSGGSFLLYMVFGLLVAWFMDMSMLSPLTWLAVILWPAVLVFEMFVLASKALFLILAVLLVLQGAVVSRNMLASKRRL